MAHYYSGLDRAGHAIAEKIQIEKHDRAWAKYYAEKSETRLVKILANQVNNPELTDADFRSLVRDSLLKSSI